MLSTPHAATRRAPGSGSLKAWSSSGEAPWAGPSTTVSVSPLTLKGPEGAIDTIHVTDPEEQADLQKVKKGDTIRARFTEALAINVERQPKEG